MSGAQVRIAVSGSPGIDECRRVAKRLAVAHRFDELGVGRAGLIATELATNLVRHAGRGEMLIQMLEAGFGAELELLAIDCGPGMRDVDDCLRGRDCDDIGGATAAGAAQGLGAVARLSTVFDVFSIPGRGTVVLSRTARKDLVAPNSIRAVRNVEIGAVSMRAPEETGGGDAWRVALGESSVSLLLVDALGRDAASARVARMAAAAFARRPFDEPSATLRTLHHELSGSGGAAAACARLHLHGMKMEYAGVGTMAGAVVTRERARNLVSHEGTLGRQCRRGHQFEYEWPLGSRVVLHSDGLAARWSLSAYPGLHLRHSAVIAAVLYRDFARGDAAVTVMIACLR